MAKAHAMTTLRDCALDYHALGWCIIPIPHGEKKAHISWKPYQTERPDREQLERWFGNGHPQNMAIVLGPVSGDLCCRDFDTAAEYERWKSEHPDLAATLPTSKTFRGYQMFYQGTLEGRIDIEGEGGEHLGELRGSGHYCMLPPSLHPEGVWYRWIVEPHSDNLLVVDPEKVGLVPKNSHVTENAETTEMTEKPPSPPIISSVLLRSLCDIKVDEKVLGAIELTLPMELGTRHRRVFDFARELKSMPEFTDADPREFVPVVLREWHRRALPKIHTEPFEETVIDFLKAWPEIKYKIGEGPMAEMYERAMTMPPPKVAVEKHPDHPKLITLIAFCRELQRAAGAGPFFLGCRTAGGLLKVCPKQASRWFFLLGSEGILEVVVKGGTRQNPRKATRFRYLGD